MLTNIDSKFKDFEDFTRKFLTSLGFEIFEENSVLPKNEKKYDVDFVTQHGKQKFYIEVKYCTNPHLIRRLSMIYSRIPFPPKVTRILIVSCPVCEMIKNEILNDFNVHIIDFSNLLYYVENDFKLKTQLLSLTEYSTTEIEPRKINVNGLVIKEIESVTEPSECDHAESYIDKLTKMNGSNKKYKSQEYEKLVSEILKFLFNEQLMNFIEQKISSQYTFRFDMICKIKKETSGDFFDIIKKEFHSHYLVFEYKYYKDKITQREIFTTVKYLCRFSLRNVAIIISPKGCGNKVEKVIPGILREEGKLIISLSNDDLIRMLVCVRDNEGQPEDILTVIFDNLMMSFEK